MIIVQEEMKKHMSDTMTYHHLKSTDAVEKELIAAAEKCKRELRSNEHVGILLSWHVHEVLHEELKVSGRVAQTEPQLRSRLAGTSFIVVPDSIEWDYCIGPYSELYKAWQRKAEET